MFAKKNVSVAMKLKEAFYNISMYFYNKNIIENDQIAGNETESKIPYIESHSNKVLIYQIKSFIKFINNECHIYSLANKKSNCWCNSYLVYLSIAGSHKMVLLLHRRFYKSF